MAVPQPNSTPELEQLLALRDPLRPTRRLPRLIDRLLPDPLKSYEQWQRFAGEDLVDATPAAKAFESLRIRTAAALVDDPDRLPHWLLNRLERLA
jgi:hypothetical protein